MTIIKGQQQGIDNLRSVDTKSIENEVLPEHQTLNARRLQSFLKENTFTADSINESFNLATLEALTKGQSSEAEKQMNQLASSAQAILQRINMQDLMQEADITAVEARLNTLNAKIDSPKPIQISNQEIQTVIQAIQYLIAVKKYARNLLNVEERMSKERQEILQEGAGILTDNKEKAGDMLGNIGDNWNKWTGGQKLVFGVGAIIASVMIFKSGGEDDPNSTFGKVKGVLKSMLLAAGGMWLGNKAFELFTGKSAVETVKDKMSKSTQQSDFYQEAFNVNEKGSELLSKAFVMLGEVDFLKIAEDYKQAKNAGQKKIGGYKMPADETYLALDAFFNKYPLANLERKYIHEKPPLTFNQVVMFELAENPALKLKEGIVERTKDYVSNKYTRFTEYMAATRPGTWIREKYKKYIGTEENIEKINKFFDEYGLFLPTAAQLNQTIADEIAHGDQFATENFQKTLISGTLDSERSVRHLEGSDGFIYLIAEKEITTQDLKGLEDAKLALNSQVQQVLSEKYQFDNEKVKQAELKGNIYQTDNNKYFHFVRIRK